MLLRNPYIVLVLSDAGPSARELANLYGVPVAKCIVWDPSAPRGTWRPLTTDICLYADPTGAYVLPDVVKRLLEIL